MSSYREQGGQYFKQGDFTRALQMYNKAILEEPEQAVHYSNRAICYIKLECYKAAISDAERCVEIDPNFVKGYYRQASAFAALGQLQEAISACEKAKKLSPKDGMINSMLKGLKEKRREQLFFEAISVEDEKQTISWRDIDASTSTIKIEDDKPITKENVQEIYEAMKSNCQYGKCAIHLKYCLRIIEEASEILKKRNVLEEINTQGKRMTIVGDIHGQFFDLIHLFEINGLPSEDNVYLFNGDFVDRGSFGVECVLTLFSFMIIYPNSVFLARGNHETRAMNAMYGFEGEVKTKYNENVYLAFSDVFMQLPYCHVIDSKVFVVHGGIPPMYISLDDIKKIKRGCDPQEGSIASALLWADPQTSNGSSPSIRGCGKSFGPDITHNFLDGNNLQYIVRSHEMKMNGYEWGAEGRLITVFSAPNYCDQMNNKGAYIHVITDNKESNVICKLEPLTFEASQHPNIPAMAYASFRGVF
ncbi:protein phosphatase, putative [Entamoeba histolytica HM-1:IMSS-B]|uniref:Serine/threonine-protein phosphatase T n=6 Tax=Entamoeba histolytica TaxID=5759 RepID=C4M8I7_ENTH1|nr:protein phosphatase, putative [Entamoeba histolytica HM-1:IMSS]EMD47863.1 serine/threonine protein phosphatase, putative [Entamoeba histolytica KU27]EMH72879.1 protein phosphatase, putative [Entamoeba histolytica HM-1:IMSS-B]EMS17924.1 serine/threonine protein phosphatase, putative [Entamoeba histolytica HM-3:IMSS]ENY65316.1 serine/threonine protein phosphatase, putative [Entamoeba histolytica HM-1:IMSS-A]GAT97918.1 protein phosphatase putative [Entamoeba histolytica]|eukprot:XP_653228.1 protein phosphatase, putative [Entamoeba histolytica HM-1:IMSS]